MTTPGPNVPRLEALHAMSLQLTTELSLDRVLQRVTEAALGLMHCRYAAVGVLAPDGQLLERFETAGLTPEEETAIGPRPRGHGILGLVIRERRVIRLADLTRHSASAGFPARHPQMQSFLGVPIIGRRGVFGNLYVTEKLGGGEFDEADEYVAQLLANTIATAVENAMLHEESARLLDEVQGLHRRREQFFAMVNHELRNALAGVYGWAELLVRRKEAGTVPRAAFEVLDSAEQAVALINDLLDLSRLDEDRLKLVLRRVEPRLIVQQSIRRVLPAAEARQIRLEEATAPGLPPIETDGHRVEQILTNLFSNAIKHSPEGGRITLTVVSDGEQVRFTVQDEGAGIPDGEHERIFDIYSTRPGQVGVGLGLPLSRRLAGLLGGTLEADPASESGARFILRLPLARS
ncbi:MAG TPA: GAF domain-containing sensor histidine kinase [Gemmatimonadales bacterium]|nr:GAF domain-containing sensor histidine kinase [Gemmatimonadales bacterium]